MEKNNKNYYYYHCYDEIKTFGNNENLVRNIINNYRKNNQSEEKHFCRHKKL